MAGLRDTAKGRGEELRVGDNDRRSRRRTTLNDVAPTPQETKGDTMRKMKTTLKREEILVEK